MGGRALGRVRAGDGWACARKASAGSQTHPRGTRREAGCAPGMAGHASGGRLLGARRTGGWALARRAPGSRARFEGWVCAGESDAPPPGGGTLWEAECASGSRVRAGVCRGWLGMRPEGVCGESDALGGIWVVRASWAGGEADCPPARPRVQRTRVPLGRPSRPPVALARPQRPHAQRARVPPGCPPPRAPCWPSRPPVAPATSARPRTARLPTPCPVPPSAPFRARHANSDGFAPIGRPLPPPAGSSCRPCQRRPGETTILLGLRFACWRHQGCKTVRICRSDGYFQGSALPPRFARSRRPVPRARASPGNPRPSSAGWSAAARRAPPPARGFSAQPGAWRGAGTPVRLY